MPAPSQELSRSHEAMPSSGHWTSGSAPAGTFVQDPAEPESAQDLQSPAQAVWQQTPCWQNPELQSAAAMHGWPTGFLPHEFPEHGLGARHIMLVVHIVWQSPVAGLHTYGAHDWGAAGGTQAPAPSQREANVRVEPEQLGGAHTAPAAWRRQPPVPSHEPSCLQLAGPSSLQLPRGSSPEGTSAHVPTLPTRLHALHGAAQDSLQHTSSLQKPLSHSPAAAQGCPFLRGAVSPTGPASRPSDLAPSTAPPAPSFCGRASPGAPPGPSVASWSGPVGGTNRFSRISCRHPAVSQQT